MSGAACFDPPSLGQNDFALAEQPRRCARPLTGPSRRDTTESINNTPQILLRSAPSGASGAARGRYDDAKLIRPSEGCVDNTPSEEGSNWRSQNGSRGSRGPACMDGPPDCLILFPNSTLQLYSLERRRSLSHRTKKDQIGEVRTAQGAAGGPPVWTGHPTVYSISKLASLTPIL